MECHQFLVVLHERSRLWESPRSHSSSGLLCGWTKPPLTIPPILKFKIFVWASWWQERGGRPPTHGGGDITRRYTRIVSNVLCDGHYSNVISVTFAHYTQVTAEFGMMECHIFMESYCKVYKLPTPQSRERPLYYTITPPNAHYSQRVHSKIQFIPAHWWPHTGKGRTGQNRRAPTLGSDLTKRHTGPDLTKRHAGPALYRGQCRVISDPCILSPAAQLLYNITLPEQV